MTHISDYNITIQTDGMLSVWCINLTTRRQLFKRENALFLLHVNTDSTRKVYRTTGAKRRFIMTFDVLP